MKKTLSVLSAATLLLSLAACGAKPAASAPAATPEPAAVEEPAAEAPEHFMDYSGVWVSDNDQSTVSFVPLEKENYLKGYEVTIGITRLAEFTGTGNFMDGAVELDLTDPNGGTMYGIFYPTQNTRDDGFTLTITQSDWDLLKSGTDFTKFFLDGSATNELLGEPK